MPLRHDDERGSRGERSVEAAMGERVEVEVGVGESGSGEKGKRAEEGT